jgi:hypothetical protein
MATDSANFWSAVIFFVLCAIGFFPLVAACTKPFRFWKSVGWAVLSSGIVTAVLSCVLAVCNQYVHVDPASPLGKTIEEHLKAVVSAVMLAFLGTWVGAWISIVIRILRRTAPEQAAELEKSLLAAANTSETDSDMTSAQLSGSPDSGTIDPATRILRFKDGPQKVKLNWHLIGGVGLFFASLWFNTFLASNKLNPTDGRKLETAITEIRTMIAMRQRAEDENRYLNADEQEKIKVTMAHISALGGGKGDELVRYIEAQLAYQHQVADFAKTGGAQLSTIKSKEDLARRMVLLSKVRATIDQLRQREKNAVVSQTLAIDDQVFSKVAQQLDFYRRHWNRWEFAPDGQPLFDVSERELATYNQTVSDISGLQSKEVRLLRSNRQEQLDKLKVAEQRIRQSMQ